MDQDVARNLKFIREIIASNDTVCIDVQNIEPNTGNGIELLNKLLNKNGFYSIGQSWKKIYKELAYKYLLECLRCGMAYSVERFPDDSAEKICKAFFAMFTADADYFTNWNIATDFKSADSWINISDSTFDFALGAIGRNTAGIICIEDDD